MILKMVGFTFRDSGRNIAVLYKMIKPERILENFKVLHFAVKEMDVQGSTRTRKATQQAGGRARPRGQAPSKSTLIF